MVVRLHSAEPMCASLVVPCSLYFQYGLCESFPPDCGLLCRVCSQMIGPYCCPRAQLPAVWSATAQRSLRPLCAPFRPAPAEGMSRLPALSGVHQHPVLHWKCGMSLAHQRSTLVSLRRDRISPGSRLRSAVLPTSVHCCTLFHHSDREIAFAGGSMPSGMCHPNVGITMAAPSDAQSSGVSSPIWRLLIGRRVTCEDWQLRCHYPYSGERLSL